MAEWRDIKTAPKDGTIVDLWLSSRDGVNQWRVPNCWWNGKFWCNSCSNSHSRSWRSIGWKWDKPTTSYDPVEHNRNGKWDCVTHWMPLPDHPASAGESTSKDLAERDREPKADASKGVE